MDRRSIARRLEGLQGFDDPVVAWEQYPTPPEIAAHLVHLADLCGDLSSGRVLDLGSGTGLLAIGAALTGTEGIVGIERDVAAVAVAVENLDRLGLGSSVEWIVGDVARPPIVVDGATVLMNPPFGAQAASRGDRPFLETASRLANVSISLHNASSRDFIEAFASDRNGRITHAYAVSIELDRTYPFHRTDRQTIPAEAFRIEWRHRPR